jgi:hypothetical protein
VRSRRPAHMPVGAPARRQALIPLPPSRGHRRAGGPGRAPQARSDRRR